MLPLEVMLELRDAQVTEDLSSSGFLERLGPFLHCFIGHEDVHQEQGQPLPGIIAVGRGAGDSIGFLGSHGGGGCPS